MPYNIWCEGCNKHVAMGVRYNAEKSKIGMYYTTPIYKFRMKCHLCDNHFEIKTDPAVCGLFLLNLAFIFLHAYQSNSIKLKYFRSMQAYCITGSEIYYTGC